MPDESRAWDACEVKKTTENESIEIPKILNSFNVCLSYISTDRGSRKLRYRVHRFDIDMRKDQRKLEQFLNSLEGEVVAIIPSVNPKFTIRGATATVYFLLIVEKSK